MTDFLLDIGTLNELYPDPQARSGFLRRARRILRTDRVALQRALNRHAYDEAHGLAHRIQGTIAFLGVAAHVPEKALHTLTGGLERRDLAHTGEARADLMCYLGRVEAELRRVAGD